MELADLDINRRYSYADYLLWQFQERVELIKGKLFKMSPAPSRKHQEVSKIIDWYFTSYFRGKTCKVYNAPFDVRLPKKSNEDQKVYTVVQPDLCIICDKSKLDQRGCIGAPDLVVEILSPGNTKKEMREKFEVYEESGVKEYWLVSYLEKTVLVYVLKEDGKYAGLQPYTEDQHISPTLFPEISIDLKEVFEDDD